MSLSAAWRAKFCVLMRASVERRLRFVGSLQEGADSKCLSPWASGGSSLLRVTTRKKKSNLNWLEQLKEKKKQFIGSW